MSEELLARIRSRPNDAPLPTEGLLDEAAAEIERLRDMLSEEGISPDPAPPYVAPHGPPTAREHLMQQYAAVCAARFGADVAFTSGGQWASASTLRVRKPITYGIVQDEI